MSIDFEGSGLTPTRRAVVEQAVALCPPALLVHGLTVRIGNEFWSSGSPSTSVATVKWEGTRGASRPIVQLKGNGSHWRPQVQSFGPAGRLFTISMVGVLMHELLGHVAQALIPSIDAMWTDADRRRWSYAQNAGGWQLEGGPSIIGLAYGGKFDKLDGAVQEKLLDLTETHGLPRPSDWAVTPDLVDEHRPDPEPVVVPPPRGLLVWVPNRLLTLVAKVKGGKVLVALEDIEQAGWGGEHFLEAPATVRRAIALAFHDLPEEWDNAALVAKLESGWRADAHVVDRFITNGGMTRENFRPRPTDDADIPEGWWIAREDSRGIFQINVIPAANPWALRMGDLFNPIFSARAARRIYGFGVASKGNGWWHWTTARLHGIESG